MLRKRLLCKNTACASGMLTHPETHRDGWEEHSPQQESHERIHTPTEDADEPKQPPLLIQVHRNF